MKIHKLLILCFILFALAFCMVLTISAYNYEHKGLASVPCTVYLGNTFSSPALYRCQDAMTTWNQSCFSYDCLVYGGTTTVTSCAVNDNTNTITYLDTIEGYLGLTCITQKKYTFLWTNWYVVEFDININSRVTWYTNISETAIAFSTYNGYTDLQTVVLHELGHALGLAHTDTQYYNGARVVMYPYLPTQTIIRALSEDDRLGIVDLY